MKQDDKFAFIGSLLIGAAVGCYVRAGQLSVKQPLVAFEPPTEEQVEAVKTRWRTERRQQARQFAEDLRDAGLEIVDTTTKGS